MTERETIEGALTASGGHMDKAARALRVSRRTLQNRMRSLGMTRKKAGRPKRKLFARHPKSWIAAGATALALGVGVAVAASRGRGGGSSA